MSDIKLTPLAEEDMFEIWYFVAIENKNRMNADRYIGKLDQVLQSVAASPNMGLKRNTIIPTVNGLSF